MTTELNEFDSLFGRPQVPTSVLDHATASSRVPVILDAGVHDDEAGSEAGSGDEYEIEEKPDIVDREDNPIADLRAIAGALSGMVAGGEIHSSALTEYAARIRKDVQEIIAERIAEREKAANQAQAIVSSTGSKDEIAKLKQANAQMAKNFEAFKLRASTANADAKLAYAELKEENRILTANYDALFTSLSDKTRSTAPTSRTVARTTAVAAEPPAPVSLASGGRAARDVSRATISPTVSVPTKRAANMIVTPKPIIVPRGDLNALRTAVTDLLRAAGRLTTIDQHWVNQAPFEQLLDMIELHFPERILFAE